MKELLSILFLLGACTSTTYGEDATQVAQQQEPNVTIAGQNYYIDQMLLNALTPYFMRMDKPSPLDETEFRGLYRYCTGIEIPQEENITEINNYLPDLEQGMWELLHKARTGEVYKKVGKYVGRINIGYSETGTGTLIKFGDKLKGKVVLTALHNLIGVEGNLNIIKGIGEKVEDRVYCVDCNLFLNEITFMTDLSDDQDDIVTYPTGSNWAENGKHKVYNVEKVYAFTDQNGNVLDIALFVLDKEVTDETGRTLEGVSLIKQDKNVDKCFSIGYGATFFSTNNACCYGWNTKKATMTGTLTDNENETCRLNVPLFPSQSGAPLIDNETNNVIGVVSENTSGDTLCIKLSSILNKLNVIESAQ